MKTIAVIFGGRSTEHDVSIITALASIIKPLEATGQYEVEPVYITKDGVWLWDKKLKEIKTFQTGEIDDLKNKLSRVQLGLDGNLTLVKSSQFAGRKQYKKIDVVFPATHGTHGEDGELMGVLEMANVPYVGCGVAASAIAMDKILAKQVAASAGIPSTPWVWFTDDELARDHNGIIEKIKPLQYPLFVKPARLGSSIGISRVDTPEQLNNALEVAAHYDSRIIVEQGVQNLIEVTLPILGNEQPQPALLERPLTKPEDFFDFDTKYMQGGKKGGGKKGVGGSQGYSQIPADLPKELYEKAEQLGLDVYKTVGCGGIARVDMLIDDKTGEVFFNEINPLPGGLYAHNWNKAGISAVELVNRLVALAEERWQKAQRKTVSFNTNYLKQF
jgi:D-alanine-D-alanine ligase